MDDIYQDLEAIVGEPLMTHMLLPAIVAIEPWLRLHVHDPRFWDGRHDPSHKGTTELPDPSEADRKEMFGLFIAQPNPLAGKEVIVLTAGEAQP